MNQQRKQEQMNWNLMHPCHESTRVKTVSSPNLRAWNEALQESPRSRQLLTFLSHLNPFHSNSWLQDFDPPPPPWPIWRPPCRPAEMNRKSESQNPSLKLHLICCNGHKTAKNQVKRKNRKSLTATIACQKKNRSPARVSHFNPQTSLEPQELRCGWTSCPPPSIGHPTPANAAAAKLWDESALNVVVSKFGNLWAPVVYHRFPIRIYSNCICWYPPFCFDKTKSTTCIADSC